MSADGSQASKAMYGEQLGHVLALRTACMLPIPQCWLEGQLLCLPSSSLLKHSLSTWENRMEILAPGFSLAQALLLGHMKNEPKGRKSCLTYGFEGGRQCACENISPSVSPFSK